MKKLCLIVVSFCCFGNLFSMKLVTYHEGDALINMDVLGKKKEKIRKNYLCDKDWPFLPLNNIKSGFNRLSKRGYGLIQNCDERLLLSVVGGLPIEVITLIIYKMLDNNEKSTKKFTEMPVLRAFQEYQNVKNELPYYTEIKNKSVGMFFWLSTQERGKILSLYKPTLTARLLLTNGLAMTETEIEEINELDEEIRKEFITGQQVTVIDQGAELILFPFCLNKSFITLSAGWLLADLGIIGLLYSVGVPIDGGISVGIIGGTVFSLGIISGGIYCRVVNDFKDTAQTITL